VDLQSFISSGILEAYVLGECTVREAKEVELLASQHPAIREELDGISETLLLHAKSLASNDPASSVRQNILDAIAVEEQLPAPTEAKVRMFDPASIEAPVVPISQASASSRFMLAASIVLLLGSLGLNFYQNTKLSQKDQELVALQAQNTEIAANLTSFKKDNAVLEGKTVELEQAVANLLSSPSTAKVMLNGMEKAQSSHGLVMYDKASGNGMIMFADLVLKADDQDFQLWAIVDGKPVDMGVIEVDKQGIMVPIRAIKDAQAFAITLESKGGNPQPKGDMHLMGAVS